MQRLLIPTAILWSDRYKSHASDERAQPARTEHQPATVCFSIIWYCLGRAVVLRPLERQQRGTQGHLGRKQVLFLPPFSGKIHWGWSIPHLKGLGQNEMSTRLKVRRAVTPLQLCTGGNVNLENSRIHPGLMSHLLLNTFSPAIQRPMKTPYPNLSIPKAWNSLYHQKHEDIV